MTPGRVADLTALALNAADNLPVAELHGTVCGLAAGSGGGAPVQDLLLLLGEGLVNQSSVTAFVDAALAELDAEDFSFAPLLPEDDAALGARLEALGDWCASFLTGFAAGLARRGRGRLDDCPDEVREIVRDLAAIAQIDADADADSAERDLLELEEFVKVGVLLIRSTLEDANDDTAG
jgi:uncharacterized protein YgfB (UPF0149 family)